MRRSVEGQLFKQQFKYKAAVVNRFIQIIRTCDDPLRVAAYKSLVFRMMGSIILKNIANYINLLNGSNLPDIPTRDEAIADCYTMYDKCLDKYVIDNDANFYFYFNKSMARNFYTMYKKNLRARHSDMSSGIEAAHPGMRTVEDVNGVEVIFTSFNFTELECRITRSRMAGQRKSEFLRDNTDVTENDYNRSLLRMKKILKRIKEDHGKKS